MSIQEFMRFRSDLRSDPELPRYFNSYIFGPPAVVELGAAIELLTEAANAAGYSFSSDEIVFMLKSVAAQSCVKRS